MMKRKLKFHDFDLAKMLNSEEDMIIYINSVIKDKDPSEISYALKVIRRSKWMNRIKNKKRENHTKHLKQNASLFLNMYKNLEALGSSLKVSSLKDDNNSAKKIAWS